MNQLQKELFEEARRELDEILSEKDQQPRHESSGNGHTFVLYGPVSIQRLVLTACKRERREARPLRSEDHEVA